MFAVQYFVVLLHKRQRRREGCEFYLTSFFKSFVEFAYLRKRNADVNKIF
jgi:hypothetical protein